MKKSHRTVHRLAWLLLLPALIGFVYFAQHEKVLTVPTIDVAPHPSSAGVLP